MNATTLSMYLDAYGQLVADRARQAFEPLHVPATDPVVELDLKRPLLAAQAHAATAMVKALRHQKAVFCAAEMGTGKTTIGACTVHAHANGKPYRAIALVPPHLIETWRSELRAIFPARAVEIIVLEKWDQLLLWQLVWGRNKPERPTWLIMSETTAKNGPYWEPAAHKDARGLLRCPTCSQILRKRGAGSGKPGDLMVMKDLEKSRKSCTAEVPTLRLDADGNGTVRTCGAALWQYTPKERIWAPADFIHKHMKSVFDYLIIDEAHQEKSATSARANAMGALVASCRKVIAMTGTLIGGKASHIRSLLFRLSAKSLRAEDLAWKDEMEFAHRYGRVDMIVTEKSGPSYDNRRSKGTTTKRQAEQPGVMPDSFT